MKKWFEKWALVICWVIIIGCSLYILKIKNLPQIKLPKAMQHNTIGELPIVEMADDGVFAEVDGVEENYRKKIYYRNRTQAERVMSGNCQYYLKGDELLDCINDIASLNYEKGSPLCKDLEEIGERYNIGVCYTCWGGFVQ